MISDVVFDTLKHFVPEKNVRKNEPMAAHTTFRVGGPADCFVEVETTEQLVKVQNYLRQVDDPFYIIGNGSNLLVSDDGYRGVIIQIGQRMKEILTEGITIRAQAGASMAQVAAAARKNQLTGLEFASGIPGTIGGGVVMNAGAYGGELSQVVTEVTVVDKEGEILVLDNETMEFGYRKSIIRSHPFVVTEVTMQLSNGDGNVIQSRMDELAAKRREKQPLEFPSAGSTFKRPEGYYAGELIMKAGMKGFAIGGAQVSEKHCGFVINAGNAMASDIMKVIREVQCQVREKFRVELEPEVVFLGRF